MCDVMSFPATVDEFMEQYKIVDREEVYTNGAEMVPIFRMKQWFEHEENHNAKVSKMEIIHCKDCEHWDTSWETVYGLHYCPMIDMATKKNFFCKYGTEKRGEADGKTD